MASDLLLVGPTLFGSLVAYLCFGAFLVQLANYALNPLDGNQRPIHALVSAVAVIEVGGVIIVTEYAWRVLCLATVDKSRLLALSNWSAAAPATYGSLALLAQCFFAWQIRTLAKGLARLVIPIIIAAISLAQFSAALAICVQFSQVGKNIALIRQLRPTVITQRASALAADVLVTTALTYLLWKHKSATPLSATRKLLNGLIINALENAALTTFFVALSLATYVAFPTNNLHQAFQQSIGGLYANVLMASLNGRIRRRQAQAREQGINVSFGAVPPSNGEKSPEPTPPRRPSDPDPQPAADV
ncbi:hypothetical protein FA13DRAFT_1822743 [Coprinellus micaceus]|uniref:DUF6534 domain-containing protein n=1 Tax=Coprinellus micaceus TaxID=71717 RepID=A0A4Y7S4N2_COPMI|nr:hypothetical protein FA13DRAFT_1822743 [Coprinellus micaceus]